VLKDKISAITFGLFSALMFTACGNSSPPAIKHQENPEAALLAASCSGCHQVGNSSIPSYDGASKETLLDTLNLYKSDIEGQSVMHRLMRGYSDDEIALIASYLGEADE